jgi:hypothetical protein
MSPTIIVAAEKHLVSVVVALYGEYTPTEGTDAFREKKILRSLLIPSHVDVGEIFFRC